MCGQAPEAPQPTVTTPATRKRFPTWLAALPGLVMPVVIMINVTRQLHTASQAIGPAASPAKKKGSGCVDTYGITLSSSYDYVRGFTVASPFVATPKADPNTRELATVLRGNVINNCAEPLKNVNLNIIVHGEKGRGTGSVQVHELRPGIVQQFERAWMASIDSWEITSDQ